MKIIITIIISLCLFNLCLFNKLKYSSRYLNNEFSFAKFAQSINDPEKNEPHPIYKQNVATNEIEKNAKLIEANFHELIDIFKSNHVQFKNNDVKNEVFQNLKQIRNDAKNISEKINSNFDVDVNKEEIKKFNEKTNKIKEYKVVENNAKIDSKINTKINTKIDNIKRNKIEKIKINPIPVKDSKLEEQNKIEDNETHAKKVILKDIFEELKDETIHEKKEEMKNLSNLNKSENIQQISNHTKNHKKSNSQAEVKKLSKKTIPTEIFSQADSVTEDDDFEV